MAWENASDVALTSGKDSCQLKGKVIHFPPYYVSHYQQNTLIYAHISLSEWQKYCIMLLMEPN